MIAIFNNKKDLMSFVNNLGSSHKASLTVDMLRKASEVIEVTFERIECLHGSADPFCEECIRWRPLVNRLNLILQRGKL